MGDRKCSNGCCASFTSYVWPFLGILHSFVKLTLGPILQITGITSPKREAIRQQPGNAGVSSYQITKTLQYITEEKARLEFDPQTFNVANPTGKPLCVMLTWMFAKQRYIDRYTQIYLEQGFDILTVALTPLHAMWPAKGTQVTASNVVKFLHANQSAAPIMLHGFSSGGYMWGEVSVIIANDMEKYQSILKRVKSQVWDSAVDFDSAQKGIPMAIFPKRIFMQNVLTWFFKLYFQLFHNAVLIPMMRASGEYQNVPCPVPALIFVSSTDPLGSEFSNKTVKETWTSLGIKVTFKCWDKSPHVQHLARHPKEYLTLLYNHMEQAGLLQDKEKRNARLQ